MAQESGAGSVLLWSLCLVAAIVAMFVVVMFVRKWVKQDDTSTSGAGFTLSELRELVKQGKMTQDEFEKAKVLVIGNAKTASAKRASPVPGDGKRPAM